MTKIHKDISKEIFNLISWVNYFSVCKGFSVTGLDQSVSELCLTNEHADFMCSFLLTDIKHVRSINKLLTLWANKGIKAKTDFNGKRIEDIQLSEINSG